MPISKISVEKFNQPSNFISLISSASVLRKEKDLRKLLEIAKDSKINSKKIYEALLQTYLFAGFPSALISLKIFGEYFRTPKIKKSAKSISELKQAGERTNRKIYGEKQEKLLSNVNGFSPELSEWLLIEGYGKVLSRNGLSLRERELAIVSILTSLKYEQQLFSHINGAYKLKVKLDDIKNAISVLEYLKENAKVKFGLKVFDKFLKQKGLE